MEQAGYTCIGHCEIDRFADKSYRAMHSPGEDEWFESDITKVMPGDLPEADVYCGGFPCQAFSNIGKRGGFEDTRGTLFFEVMRLAKERKPKLLFLENVAGLLTHNGGKTFATILNTLGELGYWYEYQVLNSKYFGVPQNRARVFIIGHLGEYNGRTVFPIGESYQTPTDLQGDQPYVSTILAGDKQYSYIVEGEWISKNPTELRWIDHDVLAALLRKRRIRKLTARELFRLQGFPDEHFERAHQINSINQLYKQIGNSVTVPVIYQIAKELERITSADG